MHIQIVSFDRVFDVYKGATKPGVFTEFGFELDGKSNNNGYIHWHADLVSGKNLALAMPKPNDWGNIYGVADCESGKLHVHTGALSSIFIDTMFGIAAQVAIVPLIFLNWTEFSAGDRFGSIAAILFLVFLAGAYVWKDYRLLVAARALERYASVAMTAPSGSKSSDG